MDRPLATLLMATSVSYPPNTSNRSERLPYRFKRAGSVSPAAMRPASSSISAARAWSRPKAERSTSSTVYPAGYTGIWEISPIRWPGAMVTVPSS